MERNRLNENSSQLAKSENLPTDTKSEIRRLMNVEKNPLPLNPFGTKSQELEFQYETNCCYTFSIFLQPRTEREREKCSREEGRKKWVKNTFVVQGKNFMTETVTHSKRTHSKCMSRGMSL